MRRLVVAAVAAGAALDRDRLRQRPAGLRDAPASPRSRGSRSRATSSSTSACSTVPTRVCTSRPARSRSTGSRPSVVQNTLRISTKSRGLTIGPDPLGDGQHQPRRAGARRPGRGRQGRRDAQRPVRAGVRAAGQRLGRRGGARDGSTTSCSRSTARPTPTSPTSPPRTPPSGSTGPGDTELRVARSLELVIEGSGDVVYHGRPAVSSRLEGSGDVRQVDRLARLTTATRISPGRRG